jgi:hypothetical protein
MSRILKTCLFLAATVWPAVALAGLIPGQSRVLVQTSVAQVPQDADDLQPLPTGPLSASVSRTGVQQGTWDLEAEAIFHSPNSGTVNLGYVRDNLGNFGFGGDVRFTYNFTLSEPGPIRFDYDVLFTTTDTATLTNGQPHPRIWWGMSPMLISVASQNASLPPFNFGTIPAPANPIAAAGTTIFNVPAGSHQLLIRLPAGAASGDFPGVRTAIGEVHFSIVPEPAGLVLALGACAVFSLLSIRNHRNRLDGLRASGTGTRHPTGGRP